MDAHAPAFPNAITFTPNGDIATVGQYFDKEGVSIRTYIATKMLSGMVSNPNSLAAVYDREDFAVTMCRHAVELADKLIAELSKS